MTPNIYISVPVTIDWAEVKKVIDRVAIAGVSVDITYWNRAEQYSPSLVDDCDIFAFIHQSNNWKFSEGNLPSGVYRELQRAKNLGKNIYMIYKNAENQYNFYRIENSNNVIQGIAGSTAVIWKEIEHLSCKVDYTPKPYLSNTVSKRDIVIDLETLQKVSRVSKPLTPSECTDYDPRLLL